MTRSSHAPRDVFAAPYFLVLCVACAAKPTQPDLDGSTTTSDSTSTTVTTSSAVTDVDHAPSTLSASTSSTSSTSSAGTTTTSATTTTGGLPLECPPPPCEHDADCDRETQCVDPLEDIDVEHSPQKYCFPPAAPYPGGCDSYTQDCPPGFKCAHQILSDTAPGCVPVQADASPPGSACEKLPACLVDEHGHGIYPDTCDLGSQCFDGTCRAFCMLVNDIPTCPEGYACNSGRVSQWCLQTCDPLAHECARGEVCTPDYWTFFCDDALPDPIPLFEPCFGSGCADGLTCGDPNAAVECQDKENYCCVPFCDLGAPDCPGQDQVCVPWPWQFDDPDPELAHVGTCSVPQ